MHSERSGLCGDCVGGGDFAANFEAANDPDMSSPLWSLSARRRDLAAPRVRAGPRWVLVESPWAGVDSWLEFGIHGG
eukprot:7096186-Alexandrium_andersonii.AAC.1